jgi:hypothetical protein
MKAPTLLMMDECFLERLDDNSDDEQKYDFIDDDEMAVQDASLFTPQQSTTEYAAAIKLSTTPQTINYQPPLAFPLGSLQTHQQFCGIGSSSK